MSTLSSALKRIWAQPDHHIAVSCESREFTYGQLKAKVAGICNELNKNDLQNGAIGILSTRSFLAYAGVLACIVSQNCFVPISKQNPINRSVDVLTKLKVKAILYDSFDLALVEKLRERLPHVLYLDAEMCKNPDMICLQNSSLPEFVYAVATSGSTGHPQIVKVSEKNLSAALDNILEVCEIKNSDGLSQTYDLFFDPSLAEIFMAFANGARLIPFSESYRYRAFEFIEDMKITHWSSVPTLAKLSVVRDPSERSNATLKSIIFTGEMLEPWLANEWSRRYPRAKINNLYGPVEATIWTAIKELGAENERISIGQPFKGMRFEIVDHDGSRVDSGTDGELVLSGPQVVEGYFSQSRASQEKFKKFHWNESQWFCTGDCARREENGDYVILGRIDNQFKIAGQRFSCEEIELCYSEISGGKPAIAVPVANMVVLALLADPQMPGEKVLKGLSDFLPPLAVPKRLYAFFDLSPGPTGKTNRMEIVRRIQAGEGLVEYV